MKPHLRDIRIFAVGLFLLLMPALLQAQAEQTKPGAPPVGQSLINEGVFAVQLGVALGVTSTDDEVEAESQLGELGIVPRNGWIADYPVTPDIVVELNKAVADAADSKRISLSREEALKKLDDVATGFGVSVRPDIAGKTYEPSAKSCENYPSPAAINSSYTGEGPPVVTYYCPPPDYYYLYTWVPCSFWWFDLWFPGFFILHDFHRVIHVHRRVVVITNHFNDVRTQRSFRIDPAARFGGRTFAGIGAAQKGNFIPTGVPKSAERIFNGPRAGRMPAGRTFAPPVRGGEMVRPPAGGGRMMAPPSGGGGGTRR